MGFPSGRPHHSGRRRRGAVPRVVYLPILPWPEHVAGWRKGNGSFVAHRDSLGEATTPQAPVRSDQIGPMGDDGEPGCQSMRAPRGGSSRAPEAGRAHAVGGTSARNVMSPEDCLESCVPGLLQVCCLGAAPSRVGGLVGARAFPWFGGLSPPLRSNDPRDKHQGDRRR